MWRRYRKWHGRKERREKWNGWDSMKVGEGKARKVSKGSKG